jgi:hypothetical protein
MLAGLIAKLSGLLLIAAWGACDTSKVKLQETVLDQNTSVVLGTRDNFTSPDLRILQAEPPEAESIKEETTFSASLGLQQWGLVQTSLLQTGADILKGKSLHSSFCKLKEQVAMLNLRSTIEFSEANALYDFEVNGNQLYLMDINAEVYFFEIVPVVRKEKGETDPSSNLTVKWKIPNLEAFALNEKGTGFSDAGLAFHKEQSILYVPTTIGLIAINVKTQEKKFVADKVFFKSTGLFYSDITEGFLFVAYAKHGIKVYNVRDPSNIRLAGTMNNEFFGVPNSSKFDITDFLVNNHLLEVHEDKSFDASQPDAEAHFFNASSTTQERIKNIKRNDTHKLMFVATSLGLFVVDIEVLVREDRFPERAMSHKILSDAVYMIERFHETLYALRTIDSNIASMVGLKAIVYEIFLYSTDLQQWNDFTVAPSDLFGINRMIPFNYYVDHIYIDDSKVYALGEGDTFIFERAVPANFDFHLLKTKTDSIDPFIYGYHKFIINGGDYLVAFGAQKVSDFKQVITEPEVVCPADPYSTRLFGTFSFQLNATTLNCPRKELMKLAPVESLTRTCVWSKNFTIKHSEQKFYEINGKTNFPLLTLFLVVILSLLLIWFCHSRNRSIQKEYDKLRSEIGNLKTDEKKYFESSQPADQKPKSNLGPSPFEEKNLKPNNKRSSTQEDAPEEPVDYSEDP